MNGSVVHITVLSDRIVASKPGETFDRMAVSSATKQPGIPARPGVSATDHRRSC